MKKGAILFIFLLFSIGAIAQSAESETSVPQEVVSKKKIKVFPNPATNVVNILGIMNTTRASITILDISGNEVLRHSWAIQNNAVSIPIPNLNAGIYVVRIKSSEELVQTKFYKK